MSFHQLLDICKNERLLGNEIFQSDWLHNLAETSPQVLLFRDLFLGVTDKGDVKSRIYLISRATGLILRKRRTERAFRPCPWVILINGVWYFLPYVEFHASAHSQDVVQNLYDTSETLLNTENLLTA